MRRCLRKNAILTAILLLAGATGTARAQVLDVMGTVNPVDFANFIAPQTYKDWGNEPFIAVDPSSPNKVLISGFGFGSPDGMLYYSTNGGASFDLRFPMTNPPGQGNFSAPNDQTYFYDNAGLLHGAILTSDGNVYHAQTPDPNQDGHFGRPANLWTWTARANQTSLGTADQPWMALGGGKLYVAYDGFNNSFTASSIRVAMSTDNGLTFNALNDLPANRGGQLGLTTNPGTRIAADQNGKCYVVYGYGTAYLGNGVSHVVYRLNRFSGGAAWDYTNSSANPGGLVIDEGDSTQLGDGPKFGGINEQRGNMTAIATDKTGSHVYVVYGKMDGAGVDRLYLAEFHLNGAGDLEKRPGSTVFSTPGQMAVLPSVAVADNGALAIEYQTYNALTGLFDVHYTTSVDGGLTFSDSVIYTFSSPGLPNTPSFPDRTRMLGDYMFMTALGDSFYGTFPGRGNTAGGRIDTTGMIVPFFFTRVAPGTQQVPEPGQMALFCCTLFTGALFVRRRR